MMIETEKLYDKNQYERTFTAKVLSCLQEGESWKLILDRTLFFPEEGGQTPDRGIIRSADAVVTVTDVQIDRAGIITHAVTGPVATGCPVEGEIDWKHRFSNMQQHSGEHIFSGIVHSVHGYDNVGFHLSDNTVTMDYNGYMSENEVMSAEYAVNEAIAANVPVRCWYPDPEELSAIDYRSKKAIEGMVRIVEVEGYDICACCAPHVARTGEIGIFKVVDSVKYKGGIRITALCGFRALDYFRKLERLSKETAVALNAPVDGQAVSTAIKALYDSVVRQKQRTARIGRQLLEFKIARIDPEAENAVIFAENVDEPVMREALNGLAERHSGCCAIFCADADVATEGDSAQDYRYIIASRTVDCRTVSDMLRKQFGAKGGGRPEMTQGSVRAAQSGIQAVFDDMAKKNA